MTKFFEYKLGNSFIRAVRYFATLFRNPVQTKDFEKVFSCCLTKLRPDDDVLEPGVLRMRQLTLFRCEPLYINLLTVWEKDSNKNILLLSNFNE